MKVIDELGNNYKLLIVGDNKEKLRVVFDYVLDCISQRDVYMADNGLYRKGSYYVSESKRKCTCGGDTLDFDTGWYEPCVCTLRYYNTDDLNDDSVLVSSLDHEITKDCNRISVVWSEYYLNNTYNDFTNMFILDGDKVYSVKGYNQKYAKSAIEDSCHIRYYSYPELDFYLSSRVVTKSTYKIVSNNRW